MLFKFCFALLVCGCFATIQNQDYVRISESIDTDKNLVRISLEPYGQFICGGVKIEGADVTRVLTSRRCTKDIKLNDLRVCSGRSGRQQQQIAEVTRQEILTLPHQNQNDDDVLVLLYLNIELTNGESTTVQSAEVREGETVIIRAIGLEDNINGARLEESEIKEQNQLNCREVEGRINQIDGRIIQLTPNVDNKIEDGAPIVSSRTGELVGMKMIDGKILNLTDREVRRVLDEKL